MGCGVQIQTSNRPLTPPLHCTAPTTQHPSCLFPSSHPTHTLHCTRLHSTTCTAPLHSSALHSSALRCPCVPAAVLVPLSPSIPPLSPSPVPLTHVWLMTLPVSRLSSKTDWMGMDTGKADSWPLRVQSICALLLSIIDILVTT